MPVGASPHLAAYLLCSNPNFSAWLSRQRHWQVIQQICDQITVHFANMAEYMLPSHLWTDCTL